MEEQEKKYYLMVFGEQKLFDFFGQLLTEEKEMILKECNLPLNYDIYTSECPYLEDVLN